MATSDSANTSRPPLNPAIRPGLVGEVSLTVAEDHLAPHTPKFSTPAMVMLMEQASFAAINNLLDDSQTVVGYEVNVKHLAPAGTGSIVTGQSTLTDVSGNKLRFEVVARLGNLVLGTAEHKMAVVPQELLDE